MEQVTGILGVLTGLITSAMALGIAFWAIYWRFQRTRLQYQERQLMIEKGMAPPPVLPEQRKVVTPEDALRRGLVQVFLGVGLGIGYVVLSRPGADGPDAWIAGVFGAVVGFLGLGYLAYSFIARRGAGPPSGKTDMPM